MHQYVGVSLGVLSLVMLVGAGVGVGSGIGMMSMAMAEEQAKLEVCLTTLIDMLICAVQIPASYLGCSSIVGYISYYTHLIIRQRRFMKFI